MTYDSTRRELVARLGVTIAIDGPAGSGKSTVSKRLASALNIGYLDTGAMYRALTWFTLEQGIDLDDDAAVARGADEMVLEMDSDPVDPHFVVDGVDVTAAIRAPRIAESVSRVATNLQVRSWMAREQRRRMLQARGAGSGMVAEGRDITTVVCPDADVRVLLLADPEARLKRRTLELYGEITEELLTATRAQIQDRDASDSTVSEFMTPAEGVFVVDSSGLGIDEVVSRVLTLVDENFTRRLAESE